MKRLVLGLCMIAWCALSQAMGAYQLTPGSNVFVYDYGGGYKQLDLGGQIQVQVYPLYNTNRRNVWVFGNQ